MLELDRVPCHTSTYSPHQETLFVNPISSCAQRPAGAARGAVPEDGHVRAGVPGLRPDRDLWLLLHRPPRGGVQHALRRNTMSLGIGARGWTACLCMGPPHCHRHAAFCPLHVWTAAWGAIRGIPRS